MNALVGVRSFLGGGEKIDQAVSSSLCCDYCRGKLRFERIAIGTCDSVPPSA
jgi:hypothetical protein